MLQTRPTQCQDEQGMLIANHFLLTDTDFGTVEVRIPHIPGIQYELVVIHEYAKRNLPVAPNVALLYWYRHTVDAHPLARVKYWLQPDVDCPLIDTRCPEIQYGVKYYHCVVSQFNKILWTKGMRV